MALILVTVGSDHHPFARLVQWADGLARSRPDLRVVVQHGTAPAPTVAEGEALLAFDRLQALMSEADVVVLQGGPSGIAEARRHGHLPVVVARRHELGEHVDDHQHAFSQVLRSSGRATVVETEQEFRAAVDAALSDPASHRVDAAADEAELAESVRRFGELVAPLARRPRPARTGSRS